MVLVMVQVKLAEPAKSALSVAVTVTLDVPAVVGMPVMVPLAGLTESPAGRPVADQMMVAVDEESLAELAGRGAMAVPERWTGCRVWLPRRC